MNTENIISIVAIVISSVGVLISALVLLGLFRTNKRDKKDKSERIMIKKKSFLYKKIAEYKKTIRDNFVSTDIKSWKDSMPLLRDAFTDTILIADSIEQIKWYESGKIKILKIELKDVSEKRAKNLNIVLHNHFNLMIDYMKVNLNDDLDLKGVIARKRATLIKEIKINFEEFSRKTAKYMKPDIKAEDK